MAIKKEKIRPTLIRCEIKYKSKIGQSQTIWTVNEKRGKGYHMKSIENGREI